MLTCDQQATWGGRAPALLAENPYPKQFTVGRSPKQNIARGRNSCQRQYPARYSPMLTTRNCGQENDRETGSPCSDKAVLAQGAVFCGHPVIHCHAPSTARWTTLRVLVSTNVARSGKFYLENGRLSSFARVPPSRSKEASRNARLQHTGREFYPDVDHLPSLRVLQTEAGPKAGLSEIMGQCRLHGWGPSNATHDALCLVLSHHIVDVLCLCRLGTFASLRGQCVVSIAEPTNL